MKLAEQSLHQISSAQILEKRPDLIWIAVSVRIYSSKKKAKRAIWAMRRNGWRYDPPKYRPLGNGAGPLSKKVVRKWYVVFFQ